MKPFSPAATGSSPAAGASPTAGRAQAGRPQAGRAQAGRTQALGPAAGGPFPTLALKEWGAVIDALVAGKQRILLRKGGIHEKSFTVKGARFALFPTVAHSHLAATRPEHHQFVTEAAASYSETEVQFRAVAEVVDTIEVAPGTDPAYLPQLQPWHIATAEAVLANRIQFRPKRPLHLLVVTVVPIVPVTIARVEAFSGCSSWVDLEAAVPPGPFTPTGPSPFTAPEQLELARDIRLRVTAGTSL